MKNIISTNKMVIPAIIGVASLAVILAVINPVLAIGQPTSNATDEPKITGSVNVADSMKTFIKEHRTTSFSTAASTAESQVTNGVAVGGHIGLVQGYLAYTFFVVDSENETGYNVIVDAGDGKVLYKSDGTSLKDMGKSFGFGAFGPGAFGHDHFGTHGFGGKWKMQNQEPTDQSGSQSPTQ